MPSSSTTTTATSSSCSSRFGGSISTSTTMTRDHSLPSPKKEIKMDKFIQWAVQDGVYAACARTEKQLAPGLYIPTEQNGRIFFTKQTIQTDELIAFPKSLPGVIIKEIDKFWELESEFSARGYLHRRGYLFHGPPSSGKTCLVKQLMQLVVSKGDIILECRSPHVLGRAIKALRVVEPDRHIMCILEDVDAICSEFGESRLLSLLDGEHQINKAVIIATTNYPERLDKRIKNRPRRFDRMCYIGMPTKENRTIYFDHKLLTKDLLEHPLEKWVDASEGFSYAALADLIISVTCIRTSFNQSVKWLQDLMQDTCSDNYYVKQAGTGFNPEKKPNKSWQWKDEDDCGCDKRRNYDEPNDGPCSD